MKAGQDVGIMRSYLASGELNTDLLRNFFLPRQNLPFCQIVIGV